MITQHSPDNIRQVVTLDDIKRLRRKDINTSPRTYIFKQTGFPGNYNSMGGLLLAV